MFLQQQSHPIWKPWITNCFLLCFLHQLNLRLKINSIRYINLTAGLPCSPQITHSLTLWGCQPYAPNFCKSSLSSQPWIKNCNSHYTSCTPAQLWHRAAITLFFVCGDIVERSVEVYSHILAGNRTQLLTDNYAYSLSTASPILAGITEYIPMSGPTDAQWMDAINVSFNAVPWQSIHGLKLGKPHICGQDGCHKAFADVKLNYLFLFGWMGISFPKLCYKAQMQLLMVLAVLQFGPPSANPHGDAAICMPRAYIQKKVGRDKYTQRQESFWCA